MPFGKYGKNPMVVALVAAAFGAVITNGVKNYQALGVSGSKNSSDIQVLGAKFDLMYQEQIRQGRILDRLLLGGKHEIGVPGLAEKPTGVVVPAASEVAQSSPTVHSQ